MSVDGANEIADTISFFLWFLVTGYPVPLIFIVGGLKVLVEVRRDVSKPWLRQWRNKRRKDNRGTDANKKGGE